MAGHISSPVAPLPPPTAFQVPPPRTRFCGGSSASRGQISTLDVGLFDLWCHRSFLSPLSNANKVSFL